MDTRNNDFDFDFTPIGQAIKKARTAKGMTREQLARIVDYDPRHLQAIENEGQKPSLELLIQLVTMFGVSVDEYIFPDICKQHIHAMPNRPPSIVPIMKNKNSLILELLSVLTGY